MFDMSKEKSEQLVHEKVLNFLEKRDIYSDLRYFDLWWKLKSVSIKGLIQRKVSSHISCYQETVHTGLLKRPKDRYFITRFT